MFYEKLLMFAFAGVEAPPGLLLAKMDILWDLRRMWPPGRCDTPYFVLFDRTNELLVVLPTLAFVLLFPRGGALTVV